ncbi:MAG: geranylgeranylglyceryl/heptaprenylglyceryl phosphate synthase [Desulfurococcales archaeon]|nr:geranylgeranylglyceryl/heptaprenylglyceryl phosphate synthase [Desulfurococcales archaeon]
MTKGLLKKLLEQTRESRAHFTLIDPDKTTPEEAGKLARFAAEAGTDAILVGGSIGVYEPVLSDTVKSIKESSGLPVILFPGNLNGLTPEADAVLFMSMLNSDDPYYISGVQMQAAPIVLRLGLEPLPTAYIIVGYGGAAGYVGRARPIPYEKPELAAAYALAAAMMGMRLIYLEAGSGAPKPVPPEAVSLARKLVERSGLEARIIVGGGVRRPETARTIAKAGAHILVTGNLVEENPLVLPEVVKAFKSP